MDWVPKCTSPRHFLKPSLIFLFQRFTYLMWNSRDAATDAAAVLTGNYPICHLPLVINHLFRFCWGAVYCAQGSSRLLWGQKGCPSWFHPGKLLFHRTLLDLHFITWARGVKQPRAVKHKHSQRYTMMSMHFRPNVLRADTRNAELTAKIKTLNDEITALIKEIEQ